MIKIPGKKREEGTENKETVFGYKMLVTSVSDI